MRTIAIVPIKHFASAKERLGGLLGSGSRQALVQAMFSDVLSSLRRVEGLDAIAVVTGDVVAQAAAWGGRVVVLHDEREEGQSAATRVGIGHALTAGYERVLLVPGDVPLIDPAQVDALLRRAADDQVEVAIVPDRHGEGTNALLISPPDALEPAFGPGSLERHVDAARRAGLAFRVEEVPTLAHDVDTPDDLAELDAILDECRAGAPRTRGALRQLGRSGVEPRARGARLPVGPAVEV